jgi:predicted ATPase
LHAAMGLGWERPVTRVEAAPSTTLDRGSWPGTIPAVRQLFDDGLDLGAVTILVGDNGVGKSTIIEALALGFGMSPEGGSTGARHTTRSSESDLHTKLRLRRGIGARRNGFFLRAETMHGFYTYLEENPGKGDPHFHEMSHGESFLALLDSRFGADGFYLLDEPESALSFTGCLALVGLLTSMSEGDTAQAVIATHSPIIAATPGALLCEVDETGLHPADYDDLALVRNWRSFLGDPARYLRHL